MTTQTGASGADVLNGTDGDDDLIGLGGSDWLYGGAGVDILYGDDAVNFPSPPSTGADHLYGGAGVDLLIGGFGADFLDGGDGDDLIIAGTGGSATRSSSSFNFSYSGHEDGGADIIDGGLGQDVLFISYALGAAAVVFDLRNPSAVSQITVGGVLTGSVTGIERLFSFTSGAGDDIVHGGALGDTIDGWTGDNLLYGEGGDDTLLAGPGVNLFDGGAGSDRVSFASVGSLPSDLTIDLRIAGPQQTGIGMDTFVSIENVDGSNRNDRLTGNEENNGIFDGAGGNDVLIGNGGDDDLRISRGVNGSANTLILDGGTGNDQLTYRGNSVQGIDGVGALSDTASLKGGDGDDTITVDSLGTGTIDGGAGNDTVTLDPRFGNHTIALGVGADVLGFSSTAGGAFSAVVTVGDFRAAQDRLELTAFLNGSLQNYTAYSDPFLSGHMRLLQSGADTLVQIDRDGGADSFTTLVTLQNVGAATLTIPTLDGFSSNLHGTGTGRAGGSGNDTLTSGAASDLLQGLSGNDILNGGGGSDYLDGGAGIDTALYAGLFRAYDVSAPKGSGIVAGGPEGGGDTLVNVERLKFVDGFLTTTTGDTAAQVHRIYGAALGRAPDAPGLANWVRAIDQGGATLKTVADGFIGSPEFVGRFGAGDNTQFLTLLYSNVLHRAPDQGGLDSWLAALAGGKSSRADVVIGFSNSPEYVLSTAPATEAGIWVMDPNAAIAARFYDTVFGRLPDAGGLASWTATLQGGASLNTVAQGFVASPEFQTTYGALSNDAFVRLMYQNVLHREADPSGLTGWVNSLNTGRSRAEVVVGFSESREHVVNTAPHIDDGVWFG